MSKVTITPMRQSTGVYGTVQAYEPVEVDSDLATDLLKTGNWIKGTVAKEDRPKAFTLPIGATISKITEDPEQVLDAEHLAEEVDRLGKLAENLDLRGAMLNECEADLDVRRAALNERQAELDTVAANQTAEGQRLTALAEELGKRDTALTDRGTDLDAREKALGVEEEKLAADREAHDEVVADAATAAKAKR